MTCNYYGLPRTMLKFIIESYHNNINIATYIYWKFYHINDICYLHVVHTEFKQKFHIKANFLRKLFVE